MAASRKKVRLQIPVSEELAAYVTELGKCFRWSQSAMAADLLEEGLKSRKVPETWIMTRVTAALVNAGRGRRKVRCEGGSVVYMQTFVDERVAGAVEELAVRLKSTPVRVAAMLLESAAYDFGWLIETFGTGPGQALVKLLGSMGVKNSGKTRGAVRPT